MTEDQAAEPESWLSKLAAVVPKLGEGDDIRDLNWMVAGVQVSLGSEADPNARVWSGAYDVQPPAVCRRSPTPLRAKMSADRAPAVGSREWGIDDEVVDARLHTPGLTRSAAG